MAVISTVALAGTQDSGREMRLTISISLPTSASYLSFDMESSRSIFCTPSSRSGSGMSSCTRASSMPAMSAVCWK